MILKVKTMNQLALVTTMICWSIGCAPSDRAANATDGSEPATPPAALQELVKGTPPGGLKDWVGEIVQGLDGISARAAGDLATAQREALDLYVGRQEYIEMYWGEQGRLGPTGPDELGVSVTEAETAFHELLQTLAATPLDTVKMNMKLDTLKAKMDRVLSLAEASGAPLIPPGNPPVGEGNPAR